MKKYLKTMNAVMAVAVGFLLLTAAMPPKNLDFGDFDKNNDQVIEMPEFVDVFTNHYQNMNKWCVKDKDYLSSDDFNKKVYLIWDGDNDNQLSKNEWNLAYANYLDGYVGDAYDKIDKNGDGYVAYVEYNNAVNTKGMFVDWDVNGNQKIDKDELARGIFNNWDVDGNGYIDRPEYNSFDIYYLNI